MPWLHVEEASCNLGWSLLPGAGSSQAVNDKGSNALDFGLLGRDWGWEAKKKKRKRTGRTVKTLVFHLLISNTNWSCCVYIYLGFSTWKARRTLSSEQGFWLFLWCGMIFIIFPEPSFRDFQRKG